MNSKICLTCLAKPCKVYNLDEIILENLKIRDLIHQMVPLILEEQDFSLPDILCEKCVEELIISFKFQKKCLDSLKNLRTMWLKNSLNSEIIKDDITEYVSINDYSISTQTEADIKNTLDDNSVDPLSENYQKVIVSKHNTNQENNSKSFESQLKDDKGNSSNILPEIIDSETVENGSANSNQCTICSRQFKQPQGLALHMTKMHLKKKLFQCKKCPYSTDVEDTFIKHCNRHLGIKPFPCTKCEKSFEQIGQLNKHNCRPKEECFSYTCKKCHQKFYSIEDFKEHTHDEGEQLFNKDNKVAKRPRNKTEKILKQSTENVSLQVKSEVADDVEDEILLEDKQDFTKKKKEQEIRSDKEPANKFMEQNESALCNICQQTFKNSQGLAIHRASIHFKNYLYQCDQCDRGFSTEEFYIKHRNDHLGIKPFKCNQCDKAFKEKYILNQHLITHSELTPHLCPTCGKSFSRIGSLKQHIKRHGDERPYKCSACPKTFKCLSDKMVHMGRHTGKYTQRYECNICGTCLSSLDSLSQHKMMHSGEKPLKCKFCEKSFISPSNLKCHERKHTVEKPYKCEYCWKSFCQSSDREKHTRRMHKDEIMD